jgi:hypothetical protein
VNITPDNGAEPNAAIVAHDYITNDSGIFGQETSFTKFRSKSI